MTQTNQKFLLDVICYALLLLGTILMVGPFLWMVSTSFKLPGDQFTKTLIPPTFTFDNFSELFSVDISFPLLFWNSAYISILTTVGQLLTCAMAAFCFAAVKFKGRDVLFTALLLTLLIPPQVTLIPDFIIFKYMR